MIKTHNWAKNWGFESEEEENLGNAVCSFLEKNGGTINDSYQVFPYIVRMLGGTNSWAKTFIKPNIGEVNIGEVNSGEPNIGEEKNKKK